MYCIVLLAIIICTSASCQAPDRSPKIDFTVSNFIKSDTTLKVDSFDSKCEYFIHKRIENVFFQICFWDSAKSIITSKLYIVGGKFNGPAEYFNFDGSISSKGKFRDNLFDSTWIQYFSEDSYTISNYDNGVKIGIWRDFKKNTLSVETFYDKGELKKQNVYDSVGLSRQLIFKNNQIVKEIEYRNGKIVKETDYKSHK